MCNGIYILVILFCFKTSILNSHIHNFILMLYIYICEIKLCVESFVFKLNDCIKKQTKS